MARSIRLRPWQRAALDRFLASPGPDFLAVATPGAGKTTFALAAARLSLVASPRRLVVVVPTAHLKLQWSRAAAALDLHLQAGWSPSAGRLATDMHGVVTTYQQVASSAPQLARIAHGAFVVLDEIHHAGDDRAWGESLRVAFSGAGRRLSLSGTPFRSDTQSIPFVRYDDDEAKPDFEYGYGEALAERRVVRPVYFPRINGQMAWSAPDGQVHEATFDEALDTARANQRLRTALSLEGEWLPEVLDAAHRRLCEVRARQPDAGGLVIATDQDHARGIAELMRRRLGTTAHVATSDDPAASERIAAFARSSQPWLVAVRMVSEGVDIPRLRVGVYATTTTTELFFRQAVGRFVRWVPGLGAQAAHLFIPDDPRLRRRAAEIAEARRHSLRRDPRTDKEVPVTGDWDEVESLALSAGEEQLSFFSVISAVATDAVDADGEGPEEPAGIHEDPALELRLGALPPLGPSEPFPATEPGEVPGITRSELKEQLRAANGAVARALARRTGWSHAKVNAELNRLAGLGRVAEATLVQLRTRLDHGERWLAKV